MISHFPQMIICLVEKSVLACNPNFQTDPCARLLQRNCQTGVLIKRMNRQVIGPSTQRPKCPKAQRPKCTKTQVPEIGPKRKMPQRNKKDTKIQKGGMNTSQKWR